jgi:hypothetical protein
MDLALYARVLWRFRLVVLAGLILAVALAGLAMAKITPHGLRYRNPVVWQSQATLLITQQGFPEGRALFPPAQQGKTYPFADTGRFANLTELYAQLASSDDVKLLMLREGAPRDETIGAAPLQPTNPSLPLPMLALFGYGTSAAKAVQAAELGTKAFSGYIDGQQQAAGIPLTQRVAMKVVRSVTPPIVFKPRKKTLPIVVFIAVMSAVVALAFVLENLQPRVRLVEKAGPVAAAGERRSA